jgi:hypothetical protein
MPAFPADEIMDYWKFHGIEVDIPTRETGQFVSSKYQRGINI